jgi:hypothetical protein
MTLLCLSLFSLYSCNKGTAGGGQLKLIRFKIINDQIQNI